ncbi:hypothetical protein YPPY09_3715, partial [Yersinia pestis PY-09]
MIPFHCSAGSKR